MVTPVPGHPFGRVWASAWRRYVRTEPVIASRGLKVGDLHVPLHLVCGSPAWAAFEAEARVGDVWDGRPVVYGPSPYATYGLDVTDLGTVAAAAVFPGLRDPGPWAELGGLTVRTTGSHVAPVHGSVEAFQAAIPASGPRREFGREHRRGSEQGLWLDVLPGWSMRSHLGEFTKLASAASARHNTSLYGRDIFRAVAAVPGSVLLCAMHGGQLAGGMLCIAHDRTLYLWAAGIDYALRDKLHTYRWLIWEAVAYAAEIGGEFVDAGRGNYTSKRRLGFSQVPLYAAVYPVCGEPELVARIAEMGNRIAAGSVAG
jgi:hypothetical protein